MWRNLACLLFGICLLVGCQAQFGKKPPPPKAPIHKQDLPFIKCQVCEAYIKQSMNHLKALRNDLPPGKKLSEADVLDKLENMCNPDHDAGEWITQYDISKEGDKLKIIDKGQPGKCNSECRTIARACDDLVEDTDLTELSGVLYKPGAKQRFYLTQWMCYDITGACLKKIPKHTEDRTHDEQHEPMSEEELRIQKMMRQMKSMGMSGSLYSRDDLMNGDFGMGMGGVEEEAVEDDVSQFNADGFMDDPAYKPVHAGKDSNTVIQDISSGISKAAEAVKEGATKMMDKASGVIKGLADKLGTKKQAEEKDL